METFKAIMEFWLAGAAGFLIGIACTEYGEERLKSLIAAAFMLILYVTL